MIQHVLVPMDGSPMSERALDFALKNYPEATITVLRVIDYVEESYGAAFLLGPETVRERALESAEELFEDVRKRTTAHQAAVHTVTKFGRPARVIPEYAAEHDVDTVVVGSHGRSIVSRVLIGDVALTVVQHSPVPVTVVR